ncbi:hypothetical protein V5799_024592 [Amblyomma americanum]|uniref:tRNA:m(4)X modification enzyme TRM13 n=1 Tax=Amblyomma americanum TaxID=6943 RepID=A0AAQ4EBN0_AMBAM
MVGSSYLEKQRTLRQVLTRIFSLHRESSAEHRHGSACCGRRRRELGVEPRFRTAQRAACATMSDTQCAFIVPKKGRRCRLRQVSGSRYCGEHIVLSSSEDSGHDRIVCPLDSTHTCSAALLSQHLKKCNAKRKENHVRVSSFVTLRNGLLMSLFSELV